MHKKKIFFIVNKSWNLTNFRNELINNFADNIDYKVYAVCAKDISTSKINKKIKFLNWNIESHNTNLFIELKTIINLFFIFQKHRPDVAFTFTPKANIYTSIIKYFISFKFCPNITGLGSYYLNSKFTKFIYGIIYKYLLKNSNFLFVQNKNDRKLFIEKYKFSKNKILLLPGSGINLNTFKPNYKFNKNKKIFLMPSRLLVEKGVVEFFSAAKNAKKINKNLFFYIVGDYDPKNQNSIDKSTFNEIIKSKSLKFLGYKSNISKSILNSDCIVLPSYREGLSRVLLEALALGKPIITTKVPGCDELCRNKNGLLCEVKSTDSLLEKILFFSNLSYKEILSMGKASRVLVNNYDITKVIKQYNIVTNKII